MNRRQILFAAGMLVVIVAVVALAYRAPEAPAVPAPTAGPALTRSALTRGAPPSNTPQAARPAAGVAATPAAPAALSSSAEPPTPALPPDTPAPTAAAAAAAAAQGEAQEYIVQSGDTLLGVAYDHGVSMASIQMLNDMGESTVLVAGQGLLIPPPREGESTYWVAYTLLPGDTLFGLAQRFDVTLDALTSVNRIAAEDVLSPGDALIIPVNGLVDVAAPSEPPAPAAATDTPAPQATLEPAAASATPGAIEPTAEPLPTIPSGGGNDEWAAVLLGLINSARADNGLPPLSYNATIALAAQGHANDCSQRGWCSHVGSDGADLRTRLTRVGYTPILWAGENWAWDRDLYSAFDRWFNEPPGEDPHRRNILNSRYAEIGIGIAPAYAGGWFFIADFGHR